MDKRRTGLPHRVPRAGNVLGLVLGAVLTVSAGAALGTAGCGTGSGTTATSSTAETPPAAANPTLRLYLSSSIAGALEPCGCSKDQLGGVDHLAAFVSGERARVKDAVFLGAGPLFFQDPSLTGDDATQRRWKAEALATAAKHLGFFAWAPSGNDFAAKDAKLKELAQQGGISLVAANVDSASREGSGLVSSKLQTVGGISLGVVGLVDQKALGEVSSGVTVTAAKEALLPEIQKLRTGGAQLVVVLASIGRGEALRLVDALPDIDMMVVGKPNQRGDLNDKPRPAQLIGRTLVVETSNHLQTVAVVDVFARGEVGTGRLLLADATGIAKNEELVSVADQIRDLEHRINGWEQGKTVRTEDLNARRADLEALRRKKSELEGAVAVPPSGSYFTYRLVEVRDGLGVDAQAAQVLLGYKKRVNEHNKVAFKDRAPAPLEAGQAGFVGLEACSTCHVEERKVWDKTGHAKAYATLQKDSVEFNLDCVGCHVTGYEKPGGSTVTAVDKLKDVQCEVCHGPGSLHAADPGKKGLITVKPEPASCVSACHHPPHVEGFDPVAKMQQVLGPGHGL